MAFSPRHLVAAGCSAATALVVVALLVPGGGASEPTLVGSTPEDEVTVPSTSSSTVETSTTTEEPTTTALTPTTIDAVCDDGSVNCAEIVAYDMFGPALGTEDAYSGGAAGWGPPWPNHEATIRSDGTEFRWLTGGSASYWNDPHDEAAIYARCKVVPSADSGPADGVLLQIRGLESWQRIDGEWSLHQASATAGLGGDWYDLAAFLGDDSIAATLRPGDAADRWEVPWPADGEIFHFFMGRDDLPSGQLRVPFDPDYDPVTDTFFATAQMRLVPIEGAEVDLDDIELLGNCGLDFYLNETSTRRRDYPGQPVPSAGHARSKVLTTEWQAFNWYSFPSEEPLQQGDDRTWQELRAEILADPPPVG
ncbi:MAG: hypothetical protein ACRBI6_08055 [Acidimicrobiales bacterium]